MATRKTKTKAQEYRELMEAAANYIAEDKPTVSMPDAVAKIVRPLIADYQQEVVLALLLNNKNKVIDIVTITVGLLDRSYTHAREIFREAIIANAKSVILAHNHPSGNATPSKQDISTTKSLVEAGKIIGIKMLDHVIIGKKSKDNGRI